MSALLDEVRESLALPGPDVARQIREAAGVSRSGCRERAGGPRDHRFALGGRPPHTARELWRAYSRLLAELDQVTRGSEGATPA